MIEPHRFVVARTVLGFILLLSYANSAKGDDAVSSVHLFDAHLSTEPGRASTVASFQHFRTLGDLPAAASQLEVAFDADMSATDGLVVGTGAALTWMEARRPERAAKVWRTILATACTNVKLCPFVLAAAIDFAVSAALSSFDFSGALDTCRVLLRRSLSSVARSSVLQQCAGLLAADPRAFERSRHATKSPACSTFIHRTAGADFPRDHDRAWLAPR